jgi:hypothetical protein
MPAMHAAAPPPERQCNTVITAYTILTPHHVAKPDARVESQDWFRKLTSHEFEATLKQASRSTRPGIRIQAFGALL